jgi:hypothetical protein
MKKSPTARALDLLRKEGWLAGVVEKWIAQTKQRKDLFGFIDIVAIRPAFPAHGLRGILGVQATSTENLSHRLDKIRETEAAVTWLLAGGLIEVWGFSKKGKAGARKLWQVSKRSITLEAGVLVVDAGGSIDNATQRVLARESP